MRKVFIGLIVIVSVSLLAACSEDKDEEETEVAVVSVEVEKVKKEDFIIEKSLFGRTAPNSTTPIIPSNPGEVDELKVANGDKVKKDDHLVTIASPAGNERITANKDGEIAGLK